MRKFPDSERVCAGLALLTPVLSIYLPLSLAPLIGFAAVLVVAGRLFAGNAQRFRPPAVPAASLLAVVALSLLSILWSIDRGNSTDNLPQFLATLLCGAVVLGAARHLSADARERVGRYLIAGAALGLLVLAAERATGGILITIGRPPNDHTQFLNFFSRGVAVCSVMVWPAVYAVSRRKPIWGVALATALFCLLLAFLSEAALVAMALAAVTFGLVWLSPRSMGKILSVVVVVAILGSPALIASLPAPKTIYETTNIPSSFYHRLLIWRFTADRILERPVLGWGFNSSRVIPGGKDRLDGEVALPLHPHSGALQLWLELGAAGALMGAGLAAFAAETVRRHASDRLAQAAGSATVAAAMVILMVSFGLWQSWWMSALFITSACTVAVCGSGEVRKAC